MKVKRKVDEKNFYVYSIQHIEETLKFLIYDDDINQWVFCEANDFIPDEEEYYG